MFKQPTLGYYFHMGNAGHTIVLTHPVDEDGKKRGPQVLMHTSDHYGNHSPAVALPLLNKDMIDKMISLLKIARKNVDEDDCYDVEKGVSLKKLAEDEAKEEALDDAARKRQDKRRNKQSE